MKTALTLAILTLALGGCSTGAQLVRKDLAGGRVALQGAFMPAMAEARLQMAEHCHGRFEAVELNEAVEFRCKNAAAGDETVGVAALSQHASGGL